MKSLHGKNECLLPQMQTDGHRWEDNCDDGFVGMNRIELSVSIGLHLWQ
jgi:hypothetical protein